jgi:hypothetical protein
VDSGDILSVKQGGIQNCQHCQTLELFRTLITTLLDRFHVASDYTLILASVSDINSGTLFALAFKRFRLVILLFRFAPPGGLLPPVAGLSATRLKRFTATLPLLPKSAPPFTLPPVYLICCSTDLRWEALRFSFCFSFLTGVPEELKQLNHRGRIIPSPFPPTPVKVIRHKPPHGILTTRKH